MKSLCMVLCALVRSVLCSVVLVFVGVQVGWGQFTNGQNAQYVIGQPNFTSNTANTGATGLATGESIAIDAVNNKLYVGDLANNRILRYSLPISATQPAAELVLGQADFTSNSANRGGSVAANTMSSPGGVEVRNGDLWVCDAGNHRILRFNAAHTLVTNGVNADVVLGQNSFTSNTSGLAQNKLFGPAKVVFDASGNLWVCDYFNNRVLRFAAIDLTTNGANAVAVLGQPNFTSNTQALSQSNFNLPGSLTIDLAGNLFVQDVLNNRILRFDNAVAKANGANADGVLGQSNFTTNNPVTSQNGLRLTDGSAGSGGLFISASGRLYVSDGWNHRVVWYDNAVTKPNGANADGVLGQVDFISGSSGLAQNRFTAPRGLALTGTTLFVGEYHQFPIGNSRVLVFNPIIPTTFYYGSGDPATPANWGSNPGGTGTPPADFTTAGNTYIMETGKTGTLAGNLTFGVGTTFTMQNGSTLNFGTGNLTLNGAINLGGQFVGNNTSVLSIGGSGVISGNLTFATLLQLGGLTINRAGSVINLGSLLTVNGVGINLIAGSINCLSPNGLYPGANSTFGTGTSVTGIVSVQNGVTLTNSGTINIPASNFFGLVENAVITGNPVNYLTATSGLNYTLNTTNLGTTDIEFPPTMIGQVSATGTSTLTLNNSKTVAGTFNIQGGVVIDIGPGNTLTLNGSIFTNSSGIGYFSGGTNRSLVIGGTGAFTGNLDFSGGTQQLQNFILNRPSVTISLGSTLIMNGTLTLTNGILNTNGNNLQISNTATNAISGGSPISYVRGGLSGGLTRLLLPNIAADGTSYLFPIGDASNYRPITLQNIRTVGGSPLSSISLPTGTPGTGTGLTVPFADANRIWFVNANAALTSSELVLSNLPTLPANARLGAGTMPTGAYNRINSTPSGTSISSIGQVALARWFAIGTNQQNTYTWNLPGNGAWNVPANWSPTRTTPLPDDIMQILTPNTDLQVNNIPTETIGQLIIGGGNGATAAPGKQLVAAAPGNTLTITGGVGDDVRIPAANTMWQLGGLNINLQSGTSYVVNGGLLTQQSAIQGAGSFTLNGSLEISHPDGLNGTSAGTGTIQNTGANTYNPTTIGFWGFPAINANLGTVSGKPALTSFPSLYAGNGVTLSLTSSVTLTNKAILTNAASRINLNGNTLTTNDIEVQVAGGAFIGSNTSSLVLTKTSALLNTIVFDALNQNLQNLTLSGAGLQATLGSPLTIQGSLNLTNGRLLTSGTNIPTLVPTANVSGGSATSYVEGPMARQVVNGGTNYLFPVGKAGQYLPVQWDNIGGAGVLESEAFAMGSGGSAGAGMSSVSGTEYWRSQRTSGTITSGQILLSRSAAIATGSVVGEAAAFNGVYAGRGGTLASNILRSTAITAFDGFYAIGGGLIFYYISGDPLSPMSWNTQQNGMGVAPMSLTATGTELVIDGNRTITVSMPFTLAAGVRLRVVAGSTLSVASNQVFTNNGTVEMLGTLELQGNGDWQGTAPQYITGVSPASRPTLRYAGGMPTSGITTDIELPAMGFNGDLVINNPQGVTLNQATTLGTEGRLVMQNGVLQGDDAKKLTITNTNADAVSGGSPSSFVVPSLRRHLPPNLNQSTNVYAFPIGALAQDVMPPALVYLPFGLTRSSTGTMGAVVEITARTTPVSGSLGIGIAAISTAEHWQTLVLSGSYLGGSVLLAGRSPQSGNIAAFVQSSQVNSLLGSVIGSGFAVNGIAAQNSVSGLPTAFTLASGAIPPTITALRPDSAGVGYEVAVEGTGLGVLQSLTVGGMNVPFRTVSDARVVFTPSPNLAGQVRVQSQNGVATSVQSFGFVPAPTLASTIPASVSSGTVLTLTGTNFLGTTQSMNGSIPLQVWFGALQAQRVEIVSPTQIRVTVPSTTANTQGQFRIQTAGGTIATMGLVNIISTTVISGFTPLQGGIGTTIRVTGANFTQGMTAALRTESGGGFTLPVTFISSSQVSISIGENQNFGMLTNLRLSLNTLSGTFIAPQAFQFVPPPRIDSVFQGTNTSIPAQTLQSGVAIRITGQNLVGVRSVTIGGEPALSFEAISDREIIVRPGGGAAGTIRIEAAGGVVTSTQSFGFLQAPAILGISPQLATTGSVIVITGVNLALVRSVSFGGTPAASFRIVSPTRIEAILGQGATGAVTLDAGMFTISAPQQFTFATPPVITALEPLRATTGTVITVRGQNLNFISDVNTGGGGNVQSFMIVSSTEARIVLGGGGTSGALRFQSLFGNVVSGQAIEFVSGLQPLPPVVQGIEPREGIPNTVVTLTGFNLESVTTITINGVNARFSRSGLYTLAVTVPNVAVNISGNGLAAMIELFSPSGRVTVPLPFTFFSQVPTPSVSNVSPSEGRTGTVVTLTGENLRRVRSVLFGGIAASSIDTASASNTTIQAVVGTGASGLVEIITLTGERVPTMQNFRFIPSEITQVPQSPMQRDSATLVRLYNALGGAEWRTNTGWLSNAPVATWFGVETTTFEVGTQATVRITGLRLPNNRVVVRDTALLRTILNQSLFRAVSFATDSTSLAFLRVLDLSDNALQTPLVLDFLLFPFLRTANLSNTGLSGTLQTLCERVRSLPNGAQALVLEEINLAGNALTGSIPDCLGGMQSSFLNLRVLNLARNRFSGSFPASILALPSIRVVNAANNQLTGQVPTLRAAQTLNLAQNQALKQNQQTHSATSLEVLILSGNLISGTIPSAMGDFMNMKELNLSNNRLSGTIPAALAQMQALERCLLDSNALEGAVPEDLTRLRNLRTLNLSSNALQRLPNLTQIRALDTLRVERNNLSFADLEPNTPVRTFSAIPQDSIGTPRDTVLVRGSRTVLRLRDANGRSYGGAQTLFQWFKDGVQRSREAASDELVIEPVLASDAGRYSVRLISMNPSLNALTLTSRALTLRTVAPPPPQTAPILIAPNNDAQNISLRALFTWSSVATATSYQVQFADNQAFTGATSIFAANTSANPVQALRTDTRYWWRVRALAGDTSAGAASAWSEVRRFTTIRPESALELSTFAFGKVPAGDEAFGQIVLRNLGSVPLVVQSLRVVNGNEISFSIRQTLNNRLIQPNDSVPIRVEFTPVSAGDKSADIDIRYAEQGSQISSQIRKNQALTGRGSVLKVLPANFDTVRIGDIAQTTSLVINRGIRTVNVRAMRLVNRSSGVSFEESVSALKPLFPQDTTAVILRLRPEVAGLVEDELILESDQDTAQASIRAVARQPRTDDVLVTVGIRTRIGTSSGASVGASSGANVASKLSDSALPGTLVQTEVFLKEANFDDLAQSGSRIFRAWMRLNRNVLTIAPTEIRALQVRNADARSNVQRLELPTTRWNALDSTLFRFNTIAIAGDTTTTPLILERFEWGAKVENRALRSEERPVFVRLDNTATFRTILCEEGGTRLFSYSPKLRLAGVFPNPAKDALTLVYGVKDDDEITLSMVDVLGKTAKTIIAGKQLAGEYALSVRLDDVPSGAYFLVLRTRTAVLTERVEVVR